MDYTNNLLNREVKVGNKEGKITKILGVNFAEITFFNINDSKNIN